MLLIKIQRKGVAAIEIDYADVTVPDLGRMAELMGFSLVPSADKEG